MDFVGGGCLRYNHMKRDCKRKLKCEICNHYHPTVLHRYNDVSIFSRRTETDNASSNSTSHSMIVPVQVYTEGSPALTLKLYALLDPQSDSCFISESAAQKIDAQGHPMSLRLATMLGEEVVKCERVSGLSIRSTDGTVDVSLPPTYTRGSIPAEHHQIPRKETVERWPHLAAIGSKLPPYDSTLEIGLLLGFNCPQVLKPREVVPGADSDPYAIRTDLGWGIIGVMGKSTGEARFAYRTSTKEIDPGQVQKMFELDFSEKRAEEDSQGLSVEDHRFLSIMKDGIRQLDNGHFELPLPFKEDQVRLPNNRPLALKRLNGLKRRLSRDEMYHRRYTEFMDDLLTKGYAEEAPQETVEGRVWYVPHHGVPKKPDKVRVVYDCSAIYQGEALNHHLLQGPDLLNNLTGVLCRFRKERIAFTGDIEAMFYQVSVPERDRDMLRFLW
ncbi:uncharacterized protein LOC135489762 [Lineus longissimus]|uniref:uncharacterized protein LOC135489762 n=1 Tax=Lineus longissimus TaxID=88925 RepID=UPI00315CB4FA